MRSPRTGLSGLSQGLCLLLAGWLLALAAHAGNVEVRAFLDRDHARLGDTVTLNVQVIGSTPVGTPDISALAADFEILGTSRNTRIRIVNGQRSVTRLWAVQLRPRHAGTLRIPALTVAGHTTAPQTLTVTAAPHTAHGGPGSPVFIEVEPSTRHPYVGQQVALSVRLYYTPNINSGSLDGPHADHAEVRALGKGTRYRSQRGGRIYRVLEKHYAIIARQAGPLDLAPVSFRGTAAVPGRVTGFFSQGRTVTARSASIQFDVRARPAASGQGAWLPARKLTLQLKGLPADGRLTVGQPLSLVLTAKAKGLPFESLPKPRLPQLEGVDVYPDQPHGQTGHNGPWLAGTRTRKFVLVPRHAGQLAIPAITLAWWNVKTDQKEAARIPAHTLQVVAAVGAATPAVAATAMPSASVEPPVPTHASGPEIKASAASGSADHVLVWVVLGLWAAIMLAVVGCWWWRRGTTAPARASTRRLRRAFFAAARSDDVTAQCDALLAWARAERASLQHLGSLAAALDSPAQRDAIAGLQRVRYAGALDAPSTQALVAAFHTGLAWRAANPSGPTDSPLPPLYP